MGKRINDNTITKRAALTGTEQIPLGVVADNIDYVVTPDVLKAYVLNSIVTDLSGTDVVYRSVTSQGYAAGLTGAGWKLHSDGKGEFDSGIVRKDLTIGGYMSSASYVSGALGSGFKISASGDAEVQNLAVRGIISASEFRVRQITSQGGSVAITNSNKIKSVTEGTDRYVCTIEDEGGSIAVQFAVDDLVRCQIWDSTRAKAYRGKIIAITSNTFDIAKPLLEGPSVPAAGDHVFQFGNATNAARQGLLYLTSNDTGAPYLDAYDGINNLSLSDKLKVRLGNMNGIVDAAFEPYGGVSGYGLYGENVFLKGKIIVTGGNAATTTGLQTAIDGLDPIARDGLIDVTKQALVFKEGGYLQSNAVFASWVDSKVVTADLISAINDKGTGQINANRVNAQQVVVDGGGATTAQLEAAIDGVKIGGRNFILDSNKTLTYPTTNLFFTLSSKLFGGVVNEIVISQDISYTGASAGGYVGFVLQFAYADNTTQFVDGRRFTTAGESYSGRHSVVIQLQNKVLSSLTWAQLNIGGTFTTCSTGYPELEIANKASSTWTAAPEDVIAQISKLVSLSGATQLIKIDKAGARTPATAFTVTATEQNTTITTWEYAVDGGTFSTGLPTGVTRSGLIVTIDPATVTFKALTIRVSDGIVADIFTVAVARDGVDGAVATPKGSVATYSALPTTGLASGDGYLTVDTGKLYVYDGTSFPTEPNGVPYRGAPGENGYTIILSNESHTFPGSETAALAGSTACDVLVYKGNTAISSTVSFGTLPAGMTASVNGSTITFNITTSLVASGTVDITIIADGMTFVRKFSYAISFKGATGKAVTSVDIEFSKTNSATVAPTTGWQTTAPAWEAGFYIWSRTKTIFSDTTTSTSLPVNIMGATGVGVSSMIEEYYLSTSKTEQLGGSWLTAPPAWEVNKYIWTRVKITYTDTTIVYTTPIVSSEWEAVNNLQIGGRNLVLNSKQELVYPATNLFLSLSSYLVGRTIPFLTISTDIEYVNASANSYIGFVLQIRYTDATNQFVDGRKFPGVVGESYKGRYSVSVALQSKEIEALVVDWAQLNIGGTFTSAKTGYPMVEGGNKASSAWSAAPEDTAKLISDISSDEKLDIKEKAQVKQTWTDIIDQYNKLIVQADAFAVTRTAYDTAYNALSTYITPLLANMAVISDIIRSEFDGKFNGYSAEYEALKIAITAKAKSLADTAQTAANTADGKAVAAQTAASNAQATANARAQTLTAPGQAPYKAGDRLILNYTTAVDGVTFTANKVYETKTPRATWLTSDWALADVQDATAAANAAVKHYYVTPSNYRIGDMWTVWTEVTVDGVTFKLGEEYQATTASAGFVAAHWVKKNKYTDDTLAMTRDRTFHTTQKPANGYITAFTIYAQGANYAVGDEITMAGGGEDARITVTAINAGAVTAATLTFRGRAYTVTAVGTSYAQKSVVNSIGGASSGTGFQIQVTGTGTDNIRLDDKWFDLSNSKYWVYATLTPANDWVSTGLRGLQYIYDALKLRTDTVGGVTIGNIFAVRNTVGEIKAYVNGIDDVLHPDYKASQHGIAFAAGVTNFGAPNESQMIALKHDGSGWLADGKIQFYANGSAKIGGWDIGANNLTMASLGGTYPYKVSNIYNDGQFIFYENGSQSHPYGGFTQRTTAYINYTTEIGSPGCIIMDDRSTSGTKVVLTLAAERHAFTINPNGYYGKIFNDDDIALRVSRGFIYLDDVFRADYNTPNVKGRVKATQIYDAANVLRWVLYLDESAISVPYPAITV